jgi:peptide/nickel transport system substrate-binding protein
MKNLKMLVCIITAILLLTTVFAILPALSSQPPLVTSTFYEGTIGQPKNVDPSQAYDTASGELIQNVYDSMLEFGSQGTNTANKPVPTVPANQSVSVGTDVAVLGQTTDIPGVCGMPQVTTLSNGSSTWIFQVNTNLVFQPWQKPDGTWVIDENMTYQDIVYYWQRFFVQDSHNSPEWMIMGPAFGVANWDANQTGAGPGMNPANETYVANLIQGFITGFSNATGQYVQMNFAYPAVGMYDILCQTWSSIPPMQFCIDHGCWNGLWTTGWSAAYRRFPSDLFTPLDEHTSKSQYSSTTAEPAMCGTGPYSFTYWNQATEEWRIDAFKAGTYTFGTVPIGCVSHPWPGPYGSADPAPTTVIETGVNTWPTRKMMFLAGDFDSAVVNRANMYDLLASTTNPYLPITGMRLYYSIPTLETDAIFFTMNITSGSPYMPIVNGAADPTVFGDLRVRWAFCQALNMSAYISGAWYGEALHPSSFWCLGLTPTAGYLSNLTAWDINEAFVYGNLSAAGITSFTMTFLYNTGNDQRRIDLQDMATVFADINSAYGTHYSVTVTSIDWPTYLSDASEGSLPFFNIGWLADFSDADDFVVPFMASWGAFTYWQRYSNSTIDSQIEAEEALGNTPAAPARCAILQTLQYEYMQQAISLPTVQPTGRHWSRDWVGGYYVNELYPGQYYQDLYKVPPTTTQPVTIDITHTITPIYTVSTVYVFDAQMRAGAYYSSGTWIGNKTQPIYVYQLSVTRTDDNTAVPELYVAIGLNRTSPTVAPLANYYGGEIRPTEEPNSTYIYLVPGQTVTITFTWSEDGSSQFLFANETGVPWQMGGDASPLTSNAVQTSNATTLLHVNDGTVTAKTLPGDLTGDGLVDIFDAVKFAAAFNSLPGMANYNPDADINKDGFIDIFDAVILAAHFGQHVSSA